MRQAASAHHRKQRLIPKIPIWIVASASFLFSLPCQAEKPPRLDETAVQDFIVAMHAQHGFDTAELKRQFAGLQPNKEVLRAIQPAAVPEQQRSWERYRQRFINARRIEGGLRFWQKHGNALQRAEQIYGVPAEVIVAIIGVETEYGQNTGKFKVMEALASLAFHYPPRAGFFRSELEHFLLLSRENRVNPLIISGSYAGAIGIPQFMPSSQRRFAVDFDHDGRIDLRSSATDAIGSVAHFLLEHGWQNNAPVAASASIDGDPAPLLAAGIKPARSLRALRGEGLDSQTEARDLDRPAALIDLVTPEKATEYWVGFDNFYVITRYNRSSFYAMAVWQLATALRENRDARLAAR